MNENPEKDILQLILGLLSEKEALELSKKMESEAGLKDIYDKFTESATDIELFYVARDIDALINEDELLKKQEKGKILRKFTGSKSKNMGSSWFKVLYFLLVVIIALVTSWGYNYYLKTEESKSAAIKMEKEQKMLKIRQDSLAGVLLKKEEELKKKGTDFNGIAITRNGYYAVPYRWAVNGTLLAFGRQGKNKIPATVVWDDEQLGLAIVEYAVSSQTTLPPLPYGFSKSDYFLGAEMLIAGKENNENAFNYGRVFRDHPDSLKMKLKLQLDIPVLGAPVLDPDGNIAGIVIDINDKGVATILKSKAMFMLVTEMNLDKGIKSIYLPVSSKIRGLSDTGKISKTAPFVACFNIRKNP